MSFAQTETFPTSTEEIDVLARKFPNRLGVGGGDFPLPGQRVEGGGSAARGGGVLLARARIDDLQRGRHIASASDKFAQSNQPQGAADGGGRRQQDQLAASRGKLLLQAHNHTKAGAV